MFVQGCNNTCCYDGVSLAEHLRHWFGSFLPKKSINFTINDHKRCFIVFIVQSFFIHDFCTNKTIGFVEINMDIYLPRTP